MQDLIYLRVEKAVAHRIYCITISVSCSQQCKYYIELFIQWKEQATEGWN